MFQYFRQTLYNKIIVAYAEAFGGAIAFIQLYLFEIYYLKIIISYEYAKLKRLSK